MMSNFINEDDMKLIKTITIDQEYCDDVSNTYTLSGVTVLKLPFGITISADNIIVIYYDCPTVWQTSKPTLTVHMNNIGAADRKLASSQVAPTANYPKATMVIHNYMLGDKVYTESIVGKYAKAETRYVDAARTICYNLCTSYTTLTGLQLQSSNGEYCPMTIYIYSK